MYRFIAGLVSFLITVLIALFLGFILSAVGVLGKIIGTIIAVIFSFLLYRYIRDFIIAQKENWSEQKNKEKTAQSISYNKN